MDNARKVRYLAAMIAAIALVKGAFVTAEAAAESDLRREVAMRQIVDDSISKYARMLSQAQETNAIARGILSQIEAEQKLAGNWQTVDGQE